MAPSLRSAAFSRHAALGLALLALTVLAACNGGNGDIEPAATEPEATVPAATATPELPRNAFEQGTAPIFWQPLDEGFKSLRVGELYKVLFRVTSGYAEATLPISAECLDCAGPVPGGTLEFDADLAQTEEEAPGSYYPFSLDLPQPGTWVVTVTAGDDTASITVEAKPAPD